MKGKWNHKNHDIDDLESQRLQRAKSQVLCSMFCDVAPLLLSLQPWAEELLPLKEAVRAEKALSLLSVSSDLQLGSRVRVKPP